MSRSSCRHCSRLSRRSASMSAGQRRVRPTRRRSALNAVGRVVRGRPRIVIIHILNPRDVAVLVDMVSKVQRFFTRPLLAKYSATQTIYMFLAVCRRFTSRKIRVVALEMFGLTCRLRAHSCYAHDTRLYPTCNCSNIKSEQITSMIETTV